MYRTIAIGALSIMLMAGCSSDNGSKASTVDAHVEKSSDGIASFEVRQVFKSLTRNYRCEGETSFDGKAGTYATASVSVQWPEKLGNVNLNAMQDSIIKVVADSGSFGRDIDKAIVAFVSKPDDFAEYKLSPVDSITEKDAMTMSSSIEVSFQSLSPKVAVIKVGFTNYLGGAHGMYGTRFLNFDLSTGKSMGYDELFTPGSHEAVFEAIKNALKEQYNVASVEALNDAGLFTDQLFVTHNIRIDGYEIVFHYNPYEIGPYALGEVDVHVPYFTIEAALTPAAKTLFSILAE